MAVSGAWMAVEAKVAEATATGVVVMEAATRAAVAVWLEHLEVPRGDTAEVVEMGKVGKVDTEAETAASKAVEETHRLEWRSLHL